MTNEPGSRHTLTFVCWGERCYCTLNTDIRLTTVHFWPWGTQTYVFDGESTFFVYSKPPTYPWFGPTFFWPRPCIHLLSFFIFLSMGPYILLGRTTLVRRQSLNLMLDCEIISYIETCYHVSHLTLVNLEDVFTSWRYKCPTKR